MFHFAVLSLVDSENSAYKYKLEEFGGNWIEGDKSHDVKYSNLPSVEYAFHVIGANSIGVWNQEGTRLSFTVRPPY